MNIKSEKILKFIKNLENEAEFIYLQHVLEIRKSIRELVQKNKMSQAEVCSHFGIKNQDYDNFISGAWHYDIETLAVINSLYIAYRLKQIEKEVPVKIPE